MRQTLEQLREDINRVDEDLGQGHVSVQEASQSVNDINRAWDRFAANIDRVSRRFGYSGGKNVLEEAAVGVWGQDVFDAFGGIKNGAATGIASVAPFFNAVDAFDGSWRDPEVAGDRITNGLTQISIGITQLGRTLSNASRAFTGISNIIKGPSSHPILSGIRSFGSGVATFGQVFRNSGIIEFSGFMTESISRIVNGDPEDIVDNGTRLVRQGSSFVAENRAKQFSQSRKSDVKKEEQENQDQRDSKEEETKTEGTTTGGAAPVDPSTAGNKSGDDYSADMIHEINVVLDGSSSSKNSHCTINGEDYKLSGYSLSQELMRPMILNFSIEKENKMETQADVIFADVTQIIGKSFEIYVSTVKTSQKEIDIKPQKAFAFKGMIIDVSASRATASMQSASVTVASWDSLLQNFPHCRSFEDKTLKEIIESVLQPYSEIKYKISPRFKDKIPYIVQYNQTDYSFISMLAMRFGEWMYSTGSEFIFGEIDGDFDDKVSLEYPGGSLMSYNLQQNLSQFAFSYILPDHYQHGKEKEIVKESSVGLADSKCNDWTELAYAASQKRYKNEQICALLSGGFDNGKDDEGADAIMSYSLKTEALGKKTGIMTVQGFSKLAMLQIGQPFLIHDSVQNKSGENEDVKQNSLKIIGVHHSFDYRQEYSNSFTAVPVACSHPAYSDAGVFSAAPSQRAKVVDNADEQKLGRIRVQFPWQEVQGKDMMTPWLRIALPYAGMGKGQYFVPEVGEEVMVGFEMNNVERPYIIGTLYNGGDGKLDEAWASSDEADGTKNNIKAIRSRNGHTILFNDKGDAGLLEIYDNKGNTYHITLSADDSKMTVYSAGQIEVVADSDINVTSKGNIGINADGDVAIKSKGNISIDASKEVSIQASKVKVR